MTRAAKDALKEKLNTVAPTVKRICDADRAKRLKYYHANESPAAVGPEVAKQIKKRWGKQ